MSEGTNDAERKKKVHLRKKKIYMKNMKFV